MLTVGLGRGNHLPPITSGSAAEERKAQVKGR